MLLGTKEKLEFKESQFHSTTIKETKEENLLGNFVSKCYI